jgi:surface protein
MKKQYLLAVAAVSLLLATGCQKEHELVTLGAEISQPAKTYIDNRYPCWNEGDEVFVNSAVYPVSAISGSSAQIVDVVGADAYRAVFPASLVTPGSNITNSATIPVTLPATQRYQVVDGHQRVDAPMGAYTDGEILQFHNLCSIVHVVVNNNTGSDMALDKLRIATDNAYLSGIGTATVTGSDNDGITLSSDASHSVSLRIAGPTSITLAAGAQSAFDIYVPAFPTDNVTITLYTTNGYYFELTKNSVALTPNTYTTVTLNVTSLTQVLAAELVNGYTFNNAIPDNATSVVFEYNNASTSNTILSTPDSPVPIYGYIDGNVWHVCTAADAINANSNCSSMFNSKSPLTSIDFGSDFNTSNVTDMHHMFCFCESLTSLNLSNFNTSNVKYMYTMFYSCESLTNLDVSNFNTANVTDMSEMFNGCSSLTSLDVSNFNTSHVTNMSGMFALCRGLTSLDVSNFNTSHVTSIGGMFQGCSGLTSLNLSNFNTSHVTRMSYMFSNCYGLTSLNLSNFNTSNVTNMYYMFSNCYSLTSLDVSNFNTSNVTNMGSMFQSCSGLTNLDLSNFNTSNVTDMYMMFSGCRSLTSLDLSNFDMSSVNNKSYMCYLLATNSHACTITCPLAVQTELENGTYLPGSVTFTWVRPTSK